MDDRVLAIVVNCTGLTEIGLDTDLWAAGMSSLQSVSVMLAVETEFDVELPESLLVRTTFSTVARLSAAVWAQLSGDIDVAS
ncbi:phosphopantetheine-binding protein [Actinoplanes derwentensis]|uniref:Phosphopantetheine attachment site n=1 Tax=Actinoplanes derwentensis TaxID=113562 RepID=A0A1H2DE80_9ACTN|nr:phosphopantetheine-binding protein [Actinoplanes derwentensis]GID89576.1 hypothetical protein Ade03nite_85000 [Actinoplanes derwentensis]SDT80556.1 Phosphopantetheine attachment site [Actinoplanes derwentensis]